MERGIQEGAVVTDAMDRPMKYEYEIETGFVDCFKDPQKEVIDRRADDGWRLVSVVESPGFVRTNFRMYFEREKD